MLAAQEDLGVRHHLLTRFAEAREQSDALFRVLRPESLHARPIPERHRFIFYIGHLEAFDWNLFRDYVFNLSSSHPEFDRLFAFGIDPVGGGLPSDRPSDWPSIETVHGYVRRVRNALDEKLSAASEHIPAAFSLETFLNVAIEHRLMHLETLAYMLHQMPFDGKIPQASLAAPGSGPVTPDMIRIPAGIASLGLPDANLSPGNSFGWDNEYQAHTVDVPAFEMDKFMVTNGQYLEFIGDAGYEMRAHWSDEGWNWKNAQSISHPVFWKRTGSDWLYRTMFEEIPLPLDWPVYVSHAEATAYARWAGKSLPSEAEWHRAAYGTPDGSERFYPWGNDAPSPAFGNLDFASWNPTPVNAHPAGQSAFGVHGMLGNGWEWTSTTFSAFPGFKPFPFYRGYSADFFDGKHFVMKGGSARTAACMLRPSFRNWFQAHYQYVYAGFRCRSSKE